MLTFKSSPEVTLIDYMGNDEAIVHAAKVSVKGGELPEEILDLKIVGLINYLMKHRHGTPFEHTSIKTRAHAPIFVFREWHRHRTGWSYNEESGRYKQLEPVFHIPAPDRPLVNIGTSARPKMAPGSREQYQDQVNRMKDAYEYSYSVYLNALDAGVAKEVAREVLPVAIFSTMYATMNLRSAFHFLSLRTHDEEAMFVSYPQYEIEQAAIQLEGIVGQLFPIAYDAFIKNRRVAP